MIQISKSHSGTLESTICRSVTRLNLVPCIYLFWETDYDQPCQIDWCHQFSVINKSSFPNFFIFNEKTSEGFGCFLVLNVEAEIQILNSFYLLLHCQTTKTAQKGT